MNTNFDTIRNDGRLIYEYIRGSHAYGLNVATSDIDTSGIFVCKPTELLGLPSNYVDMVSDAKSDNTWYEIGKFIHMLSTANPTALESLFIPKDKIIGEISPLMMPLLENRDMFLTKECFKSLSGYAYAQISKARGLNKMIVQPIVERKEVLDFCYTFKDQGSQSISEFLEERGLKQKYCGLVSIPNMKDTYGVFYDFAAHIQFEGRPDNNLFELFLELYNEDGEVEKRIENKDFFGYGGIVHPNGHSNEVRLSSIPKGEMPITQMVYNKQGYECHCKKYKQYKEWETNRNPVRYESNLNKGYDSKNMMHCTRLLHMGLELAKGEGFNVQRTWDRDFLLKIRNHEFEYDELMAYVEEKTSEFDALAKESTLPTSIDKNVLNDLLVSIREEQFKLF
jgi:predicted nucleotidyltransferase